MRLEWVYRLGSDLESPLTVSPGHCSECGVPASSLITQIGIARSGSTLNTKCCIVVGVNDGVEASLLVGGITAHSVRTGTMAITPHLMERNGGGWIPRSSYTPYRAATELVRRASPLNDLHVVRVNLVSLPCPEGGCSEAKEARAYARAAPESRAKALRVSPSHRSVPASAVLASVSNRIPRWV